MSDSYAYTREEGLTFTATDFVNAVCIMDKDGKVSVRIKRDGSVELAEGVDVDDAARRFWDAIYRYAPEMARQMLKERGE